MNLNEFIGKRVKLFVTGAKGERLGYSATILEANETSVKFRDKFDVIYQVRADAVLEVQQYANGDWKQ